MYYDEKFEDGKWWIQSVPNGKWYEMSIEGYKAKAIELSTKAVNENSVLGDVVRQSEQLATRDTFVKCGKCNSKYNTNFMSKCLCGG